MCDMHLVIFLAKKYKTEYRTSTQPNGIDRDVRYASCDFSGQEIQNRISHIDPTERTCSINAWYDALSHGLVWISRITRDALCSLPTSSLGEHKGALRGTERGERVVEKKRHQAVC
jgi:hypothetical protein